ncbi:hypothetical protein [Peijinzhouia sedimentorum]
MSEISITHIDINDEQKWKEATSDLQVSPYFLWDYSFALQKSYQQKIHLLRIETRDAGFLIIYCLRSKDGIHYDLFSPYGLGGLFFWGEELLLVYEYFKEWMKEQRIVTYFLLTDPSLVYSDWFFIEKYRSFYLMNLSISEAELWNALHKNHKYEIGKSKKSLDVEIITNKEVLLPSLKTLYYDTLDRVKANKTYYFDEETLSSLVNSPKSKLIGLKVFNKVEAVLVFLVNDYWADYFINATSNEGRFSTRWLIWEMIKDLKNDHIPYLNLGGGVQDGDYLDDFKRRFGGEKRNIGLLKGITLEDEYRELCFQNNVPTKAENYFPPYWQK